MPQNQRTEPREDSDLPILSEQEERLVEAWARGDKQKDCYRYAYGAEGYSPEALAVRACRKFAEPRIQAHLRALQATGLAKIGLTREDRLAQELSFAQRAEDAGNFGAAGGANDRVNKLLGLYVEKYQEVQAEADDPHRTLDKLAKEQGVDKALQLASIAGITSWKPEDATRH